jgi:prefoldin subunit 5
MAEVSMADLCNLLAAAAEANKATAEAGQVNAERISEINSSLEKLTLAQQEGTKAASKMETTLERVISANTALNRSVADLRQSMERVATRLTSVEATAATLSTHEQPSGRRSSHRTQGVGTGEDQTSSRALVRGEQSATYDHDIFDSDIEVDEIYDTDNTKDIHHHGRNNFGFRLPKADFLMGIIQNCGKRILKNTLNCITLSPNCG